MQPTVRDKDAGESSGAAANAIAFVDCGQNPNDLLVLRCRGVNKEPSTAINLMQSTAATVQEVLANGDPL